MGDTNIVFEIHVSYVFCLSQYTNNWWLIHYFNRLGSSGFKYNLLYTATWTLTHSILANKHIHGKYLWAEVPALSQEDVSLPHPVQMLGYSISLIQQLYCHLKFGKWTKTMFFPHIPQPCKDVYTECNSFLCLYFALVETQWTEFWHFFSWPRDRDVCGTEVQGIFLWSTYMFRILYLYEI